jgi:hypothetical protein
MTMTRYALLNAMLLCACAMGKPDVVEFLIKLGADIRSQNKDNLFPYEILKIRFDYVEHFDDAWTVVYTMLMLSNK